MGIIKATVNALRGAAEDQWKEAYCAGEMGSELLITRGYKMTGMSSANDGCGEVITDGSTVIVGEGECAVATEGGRVIGIYDQPGENIFRSDKSKGIFSGSVSGFFKDVGRRISFGGDVTIHHRLYYINTKELTGGTIRADNILLRYRHPKTGMDMDGRASCHGIYSFRIADPERFYKAAIRSQKGRSRQELLQQMDAEVADALVTALAQLTEEGVRPHEILKETGVLREKLREVMREAWSGIRGIEVLSIALESIALPDLNRINLMEEAVAYGGNPEMSAGHLMGAAANALETASANKSGELPMVAAITESWKCICGAENTRNFCTECGAGRPVALQCDWCGWTWDGKTKMPKFCTECGNALRNRNKE